MLAKMIGIDLRNRRSVEKIFLAGKFNHLYHNYLYADFEMIKNYKWKCSFFKLINYRCWGKTFRYPCNNDRTCKKPTVTAKLTRAWYQFGGPDNLCLNTVKLTSEAKAGIAKH